MSIKIGIIGTGNIAENALILALILCKEATFWSVYSRDQSKAESFASKFGAKAKHSAYDNLTQMLNDPELDGVIIATPDKLHAEQALTALKAGKHVLVEKPMCTDIFQADQMITESRNKNLCLAIAYHLRWHSGLRSIRQEILNGSIGKIVYARALWPWKAIDGSNWRASPEVGQWWSLAGVGTHCLDLLRWFMTPTCGEIERVSSAITPVSGKSGKWNSPHDELASVQLTFASGAIGEFCSSVLFDAPSRLEIYGDEGYAICEGTFGRDGAGKIITNKGEYNFGVQNPFLGEINNFIESILSCSKPEVDGIEGKKNIEILFKAVESSGLARPC